MMIGQRSEVADIQSGGVGGASGGRGAGPGEGNEIGRNVVGIGLQGP